MIATIVYGTDDASEFGGHVVQDGVEYLATVSIEEALV